jgi:secondary thiamine-phosphate synthase enzyme
MRVLRVRTRAREELRDVTALVAECVAEAGVEEGICLVQSLHTTCGLTVNENADPDVKADLLLALERAYPDSSGFKHAEGNSTAHAKTSAVGISAALCVSGGALALGTWQGVYLCEFDGPRERSLAVTVLPA